ncbi:MAG: amidohydrolase family protein [bacterium]|nr:amidohydrolase family protein [bacterium]
MRQVETILIKAGRLFDGVADRVTPQAYVIIEGDAITAVGPQGDLGDNLDRFTQQIDLGPDVTLLPGLINMHTHMSFSAGESVFDDHQRESYETKLIRAVENLQAALHTGVTTVRDCGTLNGIAFAMRAAIEQGLTLGPRVIASGAGITTTGGHLWFCGVEADSETEVRRAVRSQVKAGADFIKIFATGGGTTPGTNSTAAQYNENEMCAITEEARRLGKTTAAHAHGSPGIRTSIAARVTTIEHCSFMQPSGTLIYEPDQGRRIADAGIYVCPTIFWGCGKKLLRDEPHDAPQVRDYLEKRESRFKLVRQLVEQGVQIVSGSDAGVALNTFTDYPDDLILAVEGTDLSPVYILKSATSVAAESLGLSELGVIAAGKTADLFAVQGNPLEDIHALNTPKLVISRGRVIV